VKKFFYLLGLFSLLVGLTACAQEGESEDQAQNEPTKQTEQSSENNEQTSNKEKGNIANNNFFEPFKGKIEHVHGLGYPGNQNAVFFASHDGLKAYENGNWFQTKEENNDYMGFNAVQDGFYSSGHPGRNSQLPNPLGIMKSPDSGKTLERLTLEGETDFHVMGVGYVSNVMYVLTPNQNSLMDANKFYVSEDEGLTWKEVSAKGLGDEILSIGVHPSNPDIVAVVQKDGIYLSDDKGENFELISKEGQGTVVFFTEDYLWYGTYNGTAHLVKRSIADGSEEVISLPEMEQDAVMYLAQNPKDKNEITFISFNNDIYQTQDGSKTWNLLVKNGVLQ
jgi:hypothetical protein